MRLRGWAWLAGALAVAACVRDQPAPSRCQPAFPPGVDEGCAFTQDLLRLREAPLWPLEPEAPDALRLLVHEPMRLPLLVRAVRSPRGWDVVASASWADSPAFLRRSHTVLAEELEGVRQPLESGGFWNGPLEERPEFEEYHPCIWLLEGIRPGQYSVAQVYGEPRSPQARAVVASAMRLLKVGGLESRACGADPSSEEPTPQ